MIGAERTTVRVATGYSDEVLRQVLAWDGVHVVSVRAQGGEGR